MGYAGDKTTGFQSPAIDFVESVTDLAQILDLRRPGRYPVRVVGQRLAARGIQSGDILVADAGADPKPGKICIAMVGGDVILASLSRHGAEWRLRPSTGLPIPVVGDVEIWATVTALVRTEV